MDINKPLSKQASASRKSQQSIKSIPSSVKGSKRSSSQSKIKKIGTTKISKRSGSSSASKNSSQKQQQSLSSNKSSLHKVPKDIGPQFDFAKKKSQQQSLSSNKQHSGIELPLTISSQQNIQDAIIKNSSITSTNKAVEPKKKGTVKMDSGAGAQSQISIQSDKLSDKSKHEHKRNESFKDVLKQQRQSQYQEFLEQQVKYNNEIGFQNQNNIKQVDNIDVDNKETSQNLTIRLHQKTVHQKDHPSLDIVFDPVPAEFYKPYYLDQDTSMYSQEMMRLRKELKENPLVTTAIQNFMSIYALDKEGNISKSEYLNNHFKLASVLRDDLKLKRTELKYLLEQDWEHDSKGANSITPQQLADSLFELADIWCPSISKLQYIGFFDILKEKITFIPNNDLRREDSIYDII